MVAVVASVAMVSAATVVVVMVAVARRPYGAGMPSIGIHVDRLHVPRRDGLHHRRLNHRRLNHRGMHDGRRRRFVVVDVEVRV